MIGFTIASMLCGAAQTLPQLVLFRTLQGVFGAALVPLSQALMMETYPREEQGKAMAMWGVGTMLGPITGPTLGGWLTDEYTWRWVFYINLPVGILCAFGLMILMQEQGERHAAAVRPAGLLAARRSPSAHSSSCSTAASRSTGSAPGRSSSKRRWPASPPPCS